VLPFESVRVADFTTMLAGAGICTALSDMGADVIKIEPPDGDPWRMVAGSFMGTNRGKRSIVVNLNTEGGREIAYKLISSSDLMVENSRPGTMEKLGLDYKTVRKIKPDIIYVSLPAYSSKGPESMKPGYDPLMQALSGQMVGQGGIDKIPVFHKIALNDEAGPIVGAYGAALALLHRLKTGQGQFVETSLLNCAAALQSGQFIQYKGMKRKNMGSPDIKGVSAINRLYQGNDGEWFYLLIEKEEHWKSLCNVMGIKSLIEDPRFQKGSARKKNDAALRGILTEAFLTTPAAGWVLILQLAGVPAALSLHMDDIFKDKHCQESGIFIFQDHPDWGKVQILNVIPELSETPGIVKRPSPLLGEHTEEVLSEIGFTVEQIERFKSSKFIVQCAKK